jgi:hypothetical protein
LRSLVVPLSALRLLPLSALRLLLRMVMPPTDVGWREAPAGGARANTHGAE